MTIFKCYNDEKSSFKYFFLFHQEIYSLHAADRRRAFRKLGGFELPLSRSLTIIDFQLRSTSNYAENNKSAATHDNCKKRPCSLYRKRFEFSV